jgi:ABC-type lipoprotein export system ATPase subunit
MISTITILKGHGRFGIPDAIEKIDMNIGQVIAIVGPTGSGKTTLINDIELFANGNTPTERRVDDAMSLLRDKLRYGERLTGNEMESVL